MASTDSDESQKKRSKLCILCNKIHQSNIINLKCNHSVGEQCFSKNLEENFEEKSFYIPKCPYSECGVIIPYENLKESLPKKIYEDNYWRCAQCKQIGFSYLMKQNESCNHCFCFACLKNVSLEEETKCPKCEDDLDKNMLRFYEKSKNKCFFCCKTFDKNKLCILECCQSRFCKSCLRKELISQIKSLKQGGNQKAFCLMCRKNLKNDLVEVFLDEEEYKKYKTLFNTKKKCEMCSESKKTLVELSCEHSFCDQCLYEFLKEIKNLKTTKKIVCPVEDCNERIPNEIIDSFIKSTNSKEDSPKKIGQKSEKKNIDKEESKIEYADKSQSKSSHKEIEIQFSEEKEKPSKTHNKEEIASNKENKAEPKEKIEKNYSKNFYKKEDSEEENPEENQPIDYNLEEIAEILEFEKEILSIPELIKMPG